MKTLKTCKDNSNQNYNHHNNQNLKRLNYIRPLQPQSWSLSPLFTPSLQPQTLPLIPIHTSTTFTIYSTTTTATATTTTLHNDKYTTTIQLSQLSQPLQHQSLGDRADDAEKCGCIFFICNRDNTLNLGLSSFYFLKVGIIKTGNSCRQCTCLISLKIWNRRNISMYSLGINHILGKINHVRKVQEENFNVLFIF